MTDITKWPCSLEVRYLLWVTEVASGLGSIPSKARLLLFYILNIVLLAPT